MITGKRSILCVLIFLPILFIAENENIITYWLMGAGPWLYLIKNRKLGFLDSIIGLLWVFVLSSWIRRYVQDDFKEGIYPVVYVLMNLMFIFGSYIKSILYEKSM